MTATNDRMRILARFLRSQIALAGRPPIGRVELNNEEAEVCALALESISPLACVHPWKHVGIDADGKPFCSTCLAALVKDPPWPDEPEVPPLVEFRNIRQPQRLDGSFLVEGIVPGPSPLQVAGDRRDWDECDRLEAEASNARAAHEPKVICSGCRNEIDPETCHCGDPIKDHGYSSGHGPVPAGCDCMRASALPPPVAPLNQSGELDTFCQLVNGEATYLVRLADYERLKTALDSLAKHPNEREEMKRGGSWLNLAYRTCEIARGALGCSTATKGSDDAG